MATEADALQEKRLERLERIVASQRGSKGASFWIILLPAISILTIGSTVISVLALSGILWREVYSPGHELRWGINAFLSILVLVLIDFLSNPRARRFTTTLALVSASVSILFLVLGPVGLDGIKDAAVVGAEALLEVFNG